MRPGDSVVDKPTAQAKEFVIVRYTMRWKECARVASFSTNPLPTGVRSIHALQPHLPSRDRTSHCLQPIKLGRRSEVLSDRRFFAMISLHQPDSRRQHYRSPSLSRSHCEITRRSPLPRLKLLLLTAAKFRRGSIRIRQWDISRRILARTTLLENRARS